MKNSSIFFTEIDGKYVVPIPRSEFTINDENSEFSDDILVEWTYPQMIYQTDLIKRIFPDYSNPNIKKRKQDKGYMNVDGVVSPCIIKFIGGQGKELKVQYEFGVGVLNIMDKNLSEIDFGIIETNGLYDYIDENIGKTYPEVDICFPRVINIKYFEDFLKEYSFYGGRSIFNDSITYSGEINPRILRNEFGSTAASQIIYNKLKPTPFLLFILKKAFLTQGLILKGDIISDEYIQQICIDQNNIAEEEYVYDSKKMECKNNGVDFTNVEVKEEYQLVGRYNLAVTLTNSVPPEAYIKIELNDLTNNINLFTYERTGAPPILDPEDPGYFYPEEFVSFALPLLDNPINAEYKIFFNDIRYYIPEMRNPLNAYLNPVGTSKKYYVPKKNLILSEYMPDSTFKDIFNFVLKLRNFGVSFTSQNEIYIDYVSNEIPTKYLDLEFSEQTNPEILSNDKSEYVLAYSAPEELGFPDYLVKNRALEEVKKDDYPSATIIELNAYPLEDSELAYVGNLKLQESDSEVKGIAIFRYMGLEFGYNNGVKISNVMESVYSRSDNYIENRLDCDVMKWSFTTTRRLSELKSQMPIYAYGCFHKIKNIIKTFYENNLTKYDIETENRY